MIPKNFQGEAVYLLHYRPNWQHGFSWRIRQKDEIEEPKQRLDLRLPLNHALISRFAFALFLKGKDSADFRVGNKRLKEKRILCPFWPAAHRYYGNQSVYIGPGGEVYTAPGGEAYTAGSGETPWVFGGIWLTYELDWSQHEVHTTDAPAGFVPTATAIRVPLLLGWLESWTRSRPGTDDFSTVSIQFGQDSHPMYSLRPLETPAPEGPAIGTRIPKVFPFRPNWSKELSVDEAKVDVEREQLGEGLQALQTYHAQESRRHNEATFSFFSWQMIAAFLSFFKQRHGPVESFWLPGFMTQCRLTAPSSGASVTLNVDNAAGLGDDTHLALLSPGVATALRKIIAKDLGLNTVTLDLAPGVFPAGAATTVASLMMARFEKSEIEITFMTDRVAQCRLGFVETPEEAKVIVGEVYGTDYGARSAIGYGYRFIERFPEGPPQIARFTSFENDVVAGGEVFVSKKGQISHQTIRDSIDMENTKVEIESVGFEGNPLNKIFPNTLETPLEVEILELYPNEDGTAPPPESIWYGEVGPAPQKGQIIRAIARHRLAVLLNPVPAHIVKPTCNNFFFSKSCGVLEADWRFNGLVVSYTAATGVLVVGTITRSNGAGLPAFDAGWFRTGMIWRNNGALSFTRGISDSTAIAGGQISFTLQRPLTVAPAVGSPVSFNPGCRRTQEDCEKYERWPAGFSGDLYTPNGDPSFAPIREVSGAGKKG